MSAISEHSKSAKKTKSMPQKHTGSNAEDLQLVAERLALIQGHIGKMPSICISGVTMLNGFLLVALKVEGHDLSVSGGTWTLDGEDVTAY
jgi:hypothetical protein